MNTIPEIITLREFPYGNAKESQNADGTWTYTCQHGVNECIGNMYEACAIEHYNTTTGKVPTWWPFIYCMYKSQDAGNATVAEKCATNNGINWQTVTTCASTDPQKGSKEDGNPLMHTLAVETGALIPPHTFTPWVVVDGKPLTSSQLDLPLTPIVCNTYSAKNPNTCTLPSACKGIEISKNGIFY